MNKVVFTICAKNYLGLAQTLESSIKKYNNNINFIIFIVDEFKEDIISLPDNVLISKNVLDINSHQWNEMSFKYDITEFCTSIKPSCFKYIFTNYNTDACIYFDPDILVFNNLKVIFDNLNNNSIIVTPHITTIETDYHGSLNERNLLYSGMFNLGFLALKNDIYAQKMLNWWEQRLKDRCYQNVSESLFTDQKWIDFLPSFFPSELLISNDLGLNVAPWNFYEREIYSDFNNNYIVKSRIDKDNNNTYPLIFTHYSGYRYDLLANGNIHGGNIINLAIPSDIIPLFNDYAIELKNSTILNYIGLSYSYNFYSNGDPISTINRKLYRRLITDIQSDTSNPFDIKSEFYILMNKYKLISHKIIKNDKINLSNIGNMPKSIYLLNRILSIFYYLIGARRYFMIVRLFRLYSKYENHIFIIDKKYNNDYTFWS